ncbi:MAG: hypothetical protein KGL39_22040 [Patescibacteria group bacterium]|nr:hypothetical protein [Patescibacteria group bacterium]
MQLLEQDKARTRLHMGIPVAGIQDSGSASGYRFFEQVGNLEYRLNNLQPWEYGRIVGSPTAAVMISATPAVGNTITVTVGNLSPFTYTLTLNDLAQVDPVFSACENLVAAFNQANVASYFASTQPTVYWPVTQKPFQGPSVWQMAFVSTGQTAFTVAVSTTGTLVGTVTAQGSAIMPTVTFQEGNVTTTGYLAILDYLQAKVANSSDLAKFSKTDVVTMRYDELGYRESIYKNWRQKLADYIGCPLYPMRTMYPTGGRKTGLVI